MNAPSRPEPAAWPPADVDPSRTPPLADPDRRTGPDDRTVPDETEPPAAPPGYELLGEVGGGGMGVVYRARDAALDRDVAVKFLRARFRTDGPAAKRFLDEARITGQLQHPAIPPVHQVGALPDGRPFLVMKLIKGRTLSELLADPATDRGRLVAVFEQVCHAVGYAHAHRVVHRDLKPANVMVGAFAEVQVMDWGLAKVLTDRAAAAPGPVSDESTLGTEIQSLRDADDATRAGSVLGTPAYMPPEQAIGAVDQVDQRSDVFGLGAILCAVLTGRPPYVGADHESTRQLAARAKLDDALARLDGCGADPGLVALCKRCLAVEKADRPRDAGEVAKAVAGLRAAADERARRAELDRASSAAEAREQWKRRKVQLALAAAVLLLIGFGGAFAWWRDKEVTRQRDQLNRNGDAVAGLLTRCEEALQADDAETAALALEQAESRAAEGGANRLADRFDRCRADLGLLRALADIDAFRWTPVEGMYPEAKEVVARWRTVLAGYGVAPGETPSDEAAGRVAGSLVRDRLLATLDQWLFADPSVPLRDVLRVADPDPSYRDVVRDAVAARDRKQVAELAARPEVLIQPPGFAAAFGRHRAEVPLQRRREVMEAAVRSWTRDLGLLMGLGGSYPINQREGADERLRWFQAAVAAHPRNAAAHNNLGIALRAKGDAAGAAAAFREAIRLNPDSTPAYNNLGLALRDQNDLDGAIAAYREAIRLRPSPIPYSNLGVALAAKEDLDGAIAAYREALRLDPQSANAHANLRATLQAKFGPDAAVEEYREAIRRNPEDAPAHNSLGDALRERKDLDGAIAAYKKATELDPKLVLAHINLGDALKEKGDLDGAIAAYWAAIHLNPNYPGVFDQLRQCHIAKGGPEAAVRAAREATRLFPTSSFTHHNLGDTLQFHANDPAAAAAAYRKAISLNPLHAWSHNNLGTALRNTGDVEGAIQAFREAARLEPKFALAYRNLGRALKDKGDADGALAAFQEAVQLAPNEISARVALGDLLKDKGDVAGAIAAYREVTRRNPRNAAAHAALGQALRDMKDVVGAIDALTTAVRLDPKSKSAWSYHTHLGHALRDNKELDRAIASYRAAVGLQPTDPHVHFSLGRALREKGALAEAIPSFREAVRLDPNRAYVQLALGDASKDAGDLAGAIAAYEAVIRLNPKHGAAHYTLARLLATGPDGLRDGRRAVELAARACELSQWKYGGWIDTLAAAYAEAGEFDRAVKYQRMALNRSTPAWEKGEGKDARLRLDLYTQKKPYRDPALVPPPREAGPPPREVSPKK